MLPDGSLPSDYLEELARFLSDPTPRDIPLPNGGVDHRDGPICDLGRGLSEKEVLACEELFGWQFPPDLRSLLTFVLPTGPKFPNWREPNDELIHRLNWVRDLSLFDLQHSFWMPEWGVRPEDHLAAMTILEAELARAPALIPIFVHRMIPARPHEAGNPVLSMHGLADTIRYGNDLPDYFHYEFGMARPSWARGEPRPIEFWDRVISWRYEDPRYNSV